MICRLLLFYHKFNGKKLRDTAGGTREEEYEVRGKKRGTESGTWEEEGVRNGTGYGTREMESEAVSTRGRREDRRFSCVWSIFL